MDFQRSYNVITILTIFCLLELHLSKCGIADYKRIDIKKILQLNQNPMLGANNDYFNNEGDLEEKIKYDYIHDAIINNLSDSSEDDDDLSSAKPRNGESSSDSDSSSDSSEENIQINTPSDLKQLLNNILRSGNQTNVTKDAKNHEKNKLAHPQNEKISGTKQKLNLDADVMMNNITLRSSCNKGAAKACKKACQGVLRNVCHEYKCSHGLKNRFKLECKKNCRDKFDG